MRQGKWFFVGVSLLVALVAGVFFAGWLILFMLHVNVRWPGTPGGNISRRATCRRSRPIDLPQVAPYVFNIAISGGIGFGLPLVLWLGLFYLLFRSSERSLYGESRFAHASDLNKQDALKDDPSGIIACRFGKRLIRIGKSRHLLLAAGTRSGKGVSVVIPNCLKWLQSLVMLDVKQEAWEKSAGYRATLGPVYLFDPFTETRRSHRWNPLRRFEVLHPFTTVRDFGVEPLN